MAIALTCTCGRELRIKDKFAGRTFNCPDCGARLVVPQPVDPSEEAAYEMLQKAAVEKRQPAPVSRPDEPQQLDRPLYRPPPKEAPRAVDARAAKRENRTRKRQPRITFGEGWFGSIDAGMAGGILTMIIAIIWFSVGMAGGIIFFYPPVLFIIGLVAFVNGLFGRLGK